MRSSIKRIEVSGQNLDNNAELKSLRVLRELTGSVAVQGRHRRGARRQAPGKRPVPLAQNTRRGKLRSAAQLQFFSPPQSRRRSPVRLGCVFIFKEVSDPLLIFEKFRDVPARHTRSYVTELNCYAAAH